MNKRMPGGLRGAVLWELKTRGDINETHKGGKAVNVLHERLLAAGIDRRINHVGTTVGQLRKRGEIKTVLQERRIYAIRLNEKGIAEWPENPLKEPKKRKTLVALQPEFEVEEPAGSLLNGHAELSITQRLQLIRELADSVERDVAQLKQGVLEGL